MRKIRWHLLLLKFWGVDEWGVGKRNVPQNFAYDCFDVEQLQVRGKPVWSNNRIDFALGLNRGIRNREEANGKDRLQIGDREE